MKDSLGAVVTDRALRTVLLPLLGHISLVLAIVADFQRRRSGGGLSVLFAVVGVVCLVGAGLLFVRHPRLFFFGTDNNQREAQHPGLFVRILAWAVVICPPVLWLIAVDRMQVANASGLGTRLLGAYAFFAWIAIAINVSPYLFANRR